MKAHFESLQSQVCDCMLSHGKQAIKNRALCEDCQEAYDERNNIQTEKELSTMSNL